MKGKEKREYNLKQNFKRKKKISKQRKEEKFKK